jgi:hypothetical protein
MAELLMWNLQWVLLPTAVAGVLHMLVVRGGILSRLAQPIWLSGFGPNKTWRGVLVMTILTSLLTWVQALLWQPSMPVNPSIWGAGLGLLYVLAELPNSLVKRRLGIASGTQSARFPWLSAAIDKLDSALLGALVLALWIPGSESEFGFHQSYGFWTVASVSLASNSGIHALLSWILVALHIKQRF